MQALQVKKYKWKIKNWQLNMINMYNMTLMEMEEL